MISGVFCDLILPQGAPQNKNPTNLANSPVPRLPVKIFYRLSCFWTLLLGLGMRNQKKNQKKRRHVRTTSSFSQMRVARVFFWAPLEANAKGAGSRAGRWGLKG
jgi:hypothetical protein